jgi:hypothetical protein
VGEIGCLVGIEEGSHTMAAASSLLTKASNLFERANLLTFERDRCGGLLYRVAAWITLNFTHFDVARTPLQQIRPDSAYAQFLLAHVMPKVGGPHRMSIPVAMKAWQELTISKPYLVPTSPNTLG